ncbi:MAG: hypothetical protein WA952_16930 [Lewinella sp.]
MIAAQIVFAANVIVAGWISINSLWFPARARQVVFEGAVAYSETIRLVGALWFAIFLLSVVGIFYPRSMQPVLLLQLVYKGIWLIVTALPAYWQGTSYPRSMTAFFVGWVVVLPFVIDWKSIFA